MSVFAVFYDDKVGIQLFSMHLVRSWCVFQKEAARILLLQPVVVCLLNMLMKKC